MAINSSYVGCKAIFHDDISDLTVAETEIMEYERSTQTIVVSNSAFQEGYHDRFSVLIFQGATLLEFKGTIRRTDILPGFVGIALYQGKTREERTATRYTVNVPALVENIVVIGKLVPLYKPLEVLVLNLSTEGALMRGNINFFNIGTTFELKLDMGSSTFPILTSVLRIDGVDAETAEYGCQFYLPT